MQTCQQASIFRDPIIIKLAGLLVNKNLASIYRIFDKSQGAVINVLKRLQDKKERNLSRISSNIFSISIIEKASTGTVLQGS